jgi:hypothetical protein
LNRKALLHRAARVNKTAFRAYRDQHNLRYKVDSSLTQDTPWLEALLRDGVLVLPGFFGQDLMARIAEDLSADIRKVEDGTYQGPSPFHRFPDFGMFRLLKVDEISEAAREVFDDGRIRDIARAYVGPNVTSYQRMIESRATPGRMSMTDIFHIDDWRCRFKAFVYVKDVSELQAPFVYLKGSHKPLPWRDDKEYEYFSKGQQGPYGYLLPQEVEQLIKKYAFERVEATGPAGTLILTDTRGLHSGTPLASGKRLLLGNVFDIRSA